MVGELVVLVRDNVEDLVRTGPVGPRSFGSRESFGSPLGTSVPEVHPRILLSFFSIILSCIGVARIA